MHRNTFKGEVTVRKTLYQDKPFKGAVGYTMPTRPTQAISLMQQQIDNEITNEIMFIPFPQIRNVIVIFMKPFPKIQQDFSQILSTEYNKNRLLQNLDNSINQNISKAYHQKIKLQKIQACFKKAQKLKQSVEKFKKSIYNDRQDDDLGDKIKQIQQKYEKKKLEHRGNQQKLKEAQLEKNKSIINQFQSHYKLYEHRNNDFIALDFAYSQIKEFCKQMQTIVPIISRYEGVEDSHEEIRAQNFIKYIQMTIEQQRQSLLKFISEGETWLQMFRNDVKSESWTNSDDNQQFKLEQNRLKEMNIAFGKCEQNIRTQVYQKLKQISKLEQYIVRNLSNEVSSNMSAYERFVETYTDIKQVCNTKNRWKDFYRLIAKEEKLLSDHMRINCGLIVYYKPSEEFEQFAQTVGKRTYVNQILNERISPLINAIKFINQEHSAMYKRACEDQYSGSKLRKEEVSKKLIIFQKSLQNLERQKGSLEAGDESHYEYLTHLSVSLNRLMSLAK